MKKPDSLKAFLTAALPELARNPERLQIFVDQGRLIHRVSESTALTYEQPYRLNILLTDYAGAPEGVFVPLISWLRRNQRELFQNLEKARDAIRFEADILDEDKADLSIEFDLSERVLVRLREDASGYDVTYLDEPEFEQDTGPWPLLHRLYLGDELIAACDHDANVPGPAWPGPGWPQPTNQQTPGRMGYRHVQSTPASTWLVLHDLSYKPAVAVILADGREVEAPVQHLSDNRLTVTFDQAEAGEVRCI